MVVGKIWDYGKSGVQAGANTISRIAGGPDKATTGFFIFATVTLYLFDLMLNYVGSTFNLFGFELWLVVIDVATNGAFLFFVVLFLIYHRNQLDPTSVVMRVVLIFVVFFCMLFASPMGLIHLWLGLAIWWVLLRATSYSEASADFTFILVTLFDVFGTSLIRGQVWSEAMAGPSANALNVFVVLPIWFIVLMFSRTIPKPKGAWILTIFVLGLVFFNHYSTLPDNPLASYNGVDRMREFFKLTTGAWTGLKMFKSDWRTTWRANIDRRLEQASGGYYQGKVDENTGKDLGVYLENIQSSEKEFYDDEKAIIWGTVKTMTLDEERPVNIQLSCNAGETIPGKIMPSNLNKEFTIHTFEEEEFSCEFNHGELQVGTHNVRLSAEFNFDTMAYLKTYFMDQDKRRALIRQEVDIFEEYKITERAPIGIYTNGPIKLGAETTKTLPIGISSASKGSEESDIGMTVRLGVTMENQWQGKIKKVDKLLIEIPDSMSVNNCDIEGENVPSSEKGFRGYEIDLEGKEKYKDITTFRSFNCILKIDDPVKLLGTSPIATKYYLITASYDYELEKVVTAYVREAPGKEYVLGDCTRICLDKDGCICPGTCAGNVKINEICGVVNKQEGEVS